MRLQTPARLWCWMVRHDFWSFGIFHHFRRSGESFFASCSFQCCSLKFHLRCAPRAPTVVLANLQHLTFFAHKCNNPNWLGRTNIENQDWPALAITQPFFFTAIVLLISRWKTTVADMDSPSNLFPMALELVAHDSRPGWGTRTVVVKITKTCGFHALMDMREQKMDQDDDDDEEEEEDGQIIATQTWSGDENTGSV